jgi:hypothetical protein
MARLLVALSALGVLLAIVQLATLRLHLRARRTSGRPFPLAPISVLKGGLSAARVEPRAWSPAPRATPAGAPAAA